MTNNITEVIIIGAGPAGIACAIQLKRYNIDSILLEKEEIGGLLKNANLVENYPGFPNGISGIKLVQLINKQSESSKLNIKYEVVESIESKNDIFIVKTNGNLYRSKYLIIASGTLPLVPKVPVIQDKIKDKVFFDIYKLGKIINKTIAIIGAGDCAFDYALNLSNNNKIIILNRNEKIKALSILRHRVSKSENIKYLDNTTIKHIELQNSKIILSCNSNIVINNIDSLLIAIGRKPNLGFIDEGLLTNKNIFQIGDVKNGLFRQTSIAVGDGTFTAMLISNRLNQKN